MWLSGRASPCQGEGRGFESRRPLGEGLAARPWLSREALFRGGLAERRGNGLQIRLHRFKSGTHLEALAEAGKSAARHPGGWRSGSALP